MRCHEQISIFCRGPLLNRYSVVKRYRGFESLRLRHFNGLADFRFPVLPRRFGAKTHLSRLCLAPSIIAMRQPAASSDCTAGDHACLSPKWYNCSAFYPHTGMATKSKKAALAPKIGEPSVASKILAEFAEAVASDKELADVGARLKATLIEAGDLSEEALRQALFGDADV